MKSFVHWLGWHGTQGHVPLIYVGSDGVAQPYISSSIAICDDQCKRMLEREIDGVNVDYYGPKSASALAYLRMLYACERAGLSYSVCIDQGAVKNASDKTQAYIDVINFVVDAFCVSPAYERTGDGRPMMNFFNEPPNVDWGKVRAGIPNGDQIAFLFQGGVGFTHAESDGGYGWVNPTSNPGDINIPALDTFVNAAKQNPNKIAWYPIYPGFDDSIAGWSKHRFMARQLDRTLKQTRAKVPLDAEYELVVTWNDHEEGTAIETGVCTL
jgi:hypothetical protein